MTLHGEAALLLAHSWWNPCSVRALPRTLLGTNEEDREHGNGTLIWRNWYLHQLEAQEHFWWKSYFFCFWVYKIFFMGVGFFSLWWHKSRNCLWGFLNFLKYISVVFLFNYMKIKHHDLIGPIVFIAVRPHDFSSPARLAVFRKVLID